MKDHRHEFLQEIAQPLSGCQLLEFELKIYIERAFEVIRKKVDGIVDFGFSGDDHENSSLERLIGTFRKLSTNRELIAGLEKFKSERNFLAHRAIVACMDPEGRFEESSIQSIRPRLQEMEIAASKLCAAVYEESIKFLGHYYFGPISESDETGPA